MLIRNVYCDLDVFRVFIRHMYQILRKDIVLGAGIWSISILSSTFFRGKMHYCGKTKINQMYQILRKDIVWGLVFGQLAF